MRFRESVLTHTSTIMSIKKIWYCFMVIAPLIIGCKHTTPNNSIALHVPTSYEKELQKEQMQIVSALSGASEITENRIVKGRHKEEDKHLIRNYIRNLLKKTGISPQDHPYEITITYEDGTSNDFKGTNIYAIIPATIPSKEYIIIGAHYDAVPYSLGANDNATGCALIYGVAKQINSLKERNKNVIIVFFDQEELGLVGSKAFAQYIQGKKYNVHSVHTVDQMGWDKDQDKAIELELPTPDLYRLYKKHAQELGISVFKTDVASTDHSSFRNAGYKAIGLTEEYKNGDTTPHYHQSSDTYNTVNFEYLFSSTQLMYNAIKELVSP